MICLINPTWKISIKFFIGSLLSIPFFISFAIYGVGYIQPIQLRWSRGYICNYVVLKSEVSASQIVVIFFGAWISEVVVPSYSVNCLIWIPRNLRLVFITVVQVMVCANNWTVIWLFAHYTSHCHHYADLSESTELYIYTYIWNTCQVYSAECASKMKPIPSNIF